MHRLNFHTAIFLLLVSPAALAGDPSPNDYVRLEVRPAPATMRPGSSGVIELHFFPAGGIHVNADPTVQFSLDSASALQLTGKPAMTTDTSTGYLSAAVPVKQNVALRKPTAPGSLTVKGTVTYFYCSDSEGWCNRQKQPVEFTIVVTP